MDQLERRRRVEEAEERARDPELESIPVIVLSGERDVEEKVTAARASFVPKPVPLDRLFETMARQRAKALNRRG